MRDVAFGAGRVDDQQEMIAPVGEHQVVQNPATFVREQPIPLTAR